MSEIFVTLSNDFSENATFSYVCQMKWVKCAWHTLYVCQTLRKTKLLVFEENKEDKKIR